MIASSRLPRQLLSEQQVPKCPIFVRDSTAFILYC